MHSLLVPPVEKTMDVQVQLKKEKTTLILKEKDDEPKLSLEGMLPIVSQLHSYCLY